MVSIIYKLPEEVFVLILTEWLEKQEEIGALDVAITNSSLRKKYLEMLVRFQCKFSSVMFALQLHFLHNVCEKRLIKLVEWLRLRNVSPQRLSISPLLTSVVATISWSAFHSLRELHLFLVVPFNERDCASLDLNAILVHFPALQVLKLIAENDTKLIFPVESQISTFPSPLRRLELQGFVFPIPRVHLEEFLNAFASRFTKLERLALVDIMHMNIDSLWCLARKLPKLNSVYYTNPKFPSSISGETLAPLKGCERTTCYHPSHLRDIDLCCSGESNQEGSIALWQLLKVCSCDTVSHDGSLKSVVLRNIMLRDADEADLSDCMSSWQRLQSFAAYNCQWERTDILSMLCRQPFAVNLTSLQLTNISSVNDGHCLLISQHFTQLKTLHLVYLDHITDNGIAYLCDSLRETLEEVLVHHCFKLSLCAYQEILQELTLHKVSLLVDVKEFRGCVLELATAVATSRNDVLEECELLFSRNIKWQERDLDKWVFAFPRLKVLRLLHIPLNWQVLQRILQSCSALRVLQVECTTLECLEKVEFRHSGLSRLDLFLININLSEGLLRRIVLQCPALSVLTIYQTGCQITREVFQKLTQEFKYRLKLVEVT